jgi:hypothetical protein
VIAVVRRIVSLMLVSSERTISGIVPGTEAGAIAAASRL